MDDLNDAKEVVVLMFTGSSFHKRYGPYQSDGLIH